MNYAFWIAILVVFIAVMPAILSNRRKNDKGGDGATTATGTAGRDRDNDDSGDSDGGGGDGGGD